MWFQRVLGSHPRCKDLQVKLFFTEMFITSSQIIYEILCFLPWVKLLYIFVVKHLICEVWPKVKLGHITPQKSRQYKKQTEKVASLQEFKYANTSRIVIILGGNFSLWISRVISVIRIRRFNHQKWRVIYNRSEGNFQDCTRKKRCRKTMCLLT